MGVVAYVTLSSHCMTAHDYRICEESVLHWLLSCAQNCRDTKSIELIVNMII